MEVDVTPARAQLEMQIDEVMRRPDLGFDKSLGAPQCEGVPVPVPAFHTHKRSTVAPEPFGRWLLAQKGRDDWIDDLAASARLDPAFPKGGTPDQVRQRMGLQGADPDAFEQLNDAERCWRSLLPSDS